MSALISVEQFTKLEQVQILEVGEKTADPFTAKQALALYKQDHIGHAKYVDLTEHFSQQTGNLQYQCPSLDEFKQSFESLRLSWDKPIVIYDRANHIWAARLWWVFSAYGHPQSYVLHGGWQAWETQKIRHIAWLKPSLQYTQSVLPDDVQLNPNMFASLSDVAKVCQGKTGVHLINVLRKPVFEGSELRYHRAGHIPNSINIPFSHFLTEQGQFKTIDSEFLQQHFLELSNEIIIYCGSGVTASGAALALLEAGASNLKIYDGSMEEWSANQSLPLTLIAQ